MHVQQRQRQALDEHRFDDEVAAINDKWDEDADSDNSDASDASISASASDDYFATGTFRITAGHLSA